MSLRDAAARLGLQPGDWIPYGHDMAKLPHLAADDGAKQGTLVLVSAITPTPAGEGKTTTTIGLTDALTKMGLRACAALREPSLGPCFGVKGGGCGGGKAQLVPSTKINLHFTGDLHAITAAHNLLAALIDNHLHFEAEPRLDPRRVLWGRVIDQNDRSLRNLVVGLGGWTQGVPRESGFEITAASEVMALMCLASDLDDLRARLGRILVGYTYEREPVTVADLGFEGALLALLVDAFQPNLVTTAEGSPAIVHGGPFANIAHGCNSVVATRRAMSLADWVVTEAGFGVDLGAEKFFDIKARTAKLSPAAVVVVATVRALKYHGGVGLKALEKPDPEAVERGLPNLEKHLETIRAFGPPAVVALNRFEADSDAEIAVIRERCAQLGVRFAESRHFAEGGAGAVALGEQVVAAAAEGGGFTPLYRLEASITDKIRAVALKAYGAGDVVFTSQANAAMKRLTELGFGELPVCLAKTQSSLSDDPSRRGRPTGFTVTVQAVRVSAGAGFLVVLLGDILRMPGLPRVPQATQVDVVNGEIVGIG